MPVRISTLEEVEKSHILDALEYFEDDKVKAAKALGIGKTTIYRKLKEYGVGNDYKKPRSSRRNVEKNNGGED